MINWTDPDAKISKHFTVKEAIFLNRWSRLANESDGLNDHVKTQIVAMAKKADEVQDFLGLLIIVHSWYRPQKYNKEIGGSKSSKHMCLGDFSAMDFSCRVEGVKSQNEACDVIRASLEPKLRELGIRMERNPGSNWVHIDDAPIVLSRYFNP